MCLNTHMEPNAQPSHDPYSFILNPPPKPKKKILSGDSFGKRIMVIVGGAVVLMIAIALVGTLIFGGKTSTESITELMQTQTEVMRIATKGTLGTADQFTKNAAISAQLTFTTQRKEWQAFLSTYGISVDEKILLLKKNSKTDQLLDSAEANSTFDIAFSQAFENLLQDYKKELKAIYDTTSNTKERDLLEKHYDQTDLLLSQLPDATPAAAPTSP